MKKYSIIILGIYIFCLCFSCKKKDKNDCLKVDALIPGSGKKGDTFLISGRNFSPVLPENEVAFNGTVVVAADPISGKETQLKILVPAKCGTGSVEVKRDETSV
jgi:hypothetical protein